MISKLLDRLQLGVFISAACAIAITYYILAQLQARDMQEFNEHLEKTIRIMTGYQNVVDSTIEEVQEEEPPYHFPPGLPKDAEYKGE